jgi:hypothetical protein
MGGVGPSCSLFQGLIESLPTLGEDVVVAVGERATAPPWGGHRSRAPIAAQLRRLKIRVAPVDRRPHPASQQTQWSHRDVHSVLHKNGRLDEVSSMIALGAATRWNHIVGRAKCHRAEFGIYKQDALECQAAGCGGAVRFADQTASGSLPT